MLSLLTGYLIWSIFERGQLFKLRSSEVSVCDWPTLVWRPGKGGDITADDGMMQNKAAYSMTSGKQTEMKGSGPLVLAQAE